LAYFVKCAEVHLDQHRDDHHPDPQAHREIHLRDLHAADGLERCREKLSEGNANDDAEEYPDGQVALKDAHRRACRPFLCGFTLS